MEIITSCALIVCACVSVKLIGKDAPDMRVLAALSVIIITASAYIEELYGISVKLRKLFELANIDSEYVSILVKALGICIVAQLSSDCCKDCGESALASQIDILARISLLLISLPLYSAVIELVITLIGSMGS